MDVYRKKQIKGFLMGFSVCFKAHIHFLKPWFMWLIVDFVEERIYHFRFADTEGLGKWFL